MQVNDIAGLEPVRWDNRRMINVDITEVVSDDIMVLLIVFSQNCLLYLFPFSYKCRGVFNFLVSTPWYFNILFTEFFRIILIIVTGCKQA